MLEKRLLDGDYGKSGNLCSTGELEVSQQARSRKIQINVEEVKKNDVMAGETVGTLF